MICIFCEYDADHTFALFDCVNKRSNEKRSKHSMLKLFFPEPRVEAERVNHTCFAEGESSSVRERQWLRDQSGLHAHEYLLRG